MPVNVLLMFSYYGGGGVDTKTTLSANFLQLFFKFGGFIFGKSCSLLTSHTINNL